jgi:uncharacterized protein YbjQ (UPF0145 family)
MEKKFENCPNCNSKIHLGTFNYNELIDGGRKQLINDFTDNHSEAFCSKCFNAPLISATENYKIQFNENSESLKNAMPHIPVITLQQPLNWNYKVVGMVTGQSVTGTGIISEIASSFTDLFGMQSGNLGNKIKGGEDICKAQLRLNAAQLGATAVIGTDIDYSEVGGGKGMLMVCMSGTAIKLENLEILGNGAAEKLLNIETIAKTYNNLSRYKNLVGSLT